jgi:glutamine synthetase
MSDGIGTPEWEKRLQSVAEDLKSKGVKYIQAEVPDMDGMLRGKILSPKKGMSPTGAAWCVIHYCASVQDNLIETPLGSSENGYPDLMALPDLDTVIQWPWDPKYAAALYDFYFPDDLGLCPVSPRTVLKRQVEKAEKMGFTPRCAVEYEAVVMHADSELMDEGRYTELRPMSRTLNFYSLTRISDLKPLMEMLVERMAAIDINIEAFHTEKGPGQIEFALTHAPTLEAADQAIRAKYYLKKFCMELGLAITFMSRWNVNEVGTGAHIHQSLWRNGNPAFWDDDAGGLSIVGKQYAAGMLRTMPEFTALVNNNVNSYRRRASADWCPENASWGADNRTAALRVITKPTPKAARIETRQPGGEANPYLSVAAGLARGLYGIEQGLEPPAYAEGDAGRDERFERLPITLKEATDALKGSEIARECFGAEFVTHYVITRENEWRLWEEWLANNVTEWELRRYFDTA